MIKENEVEVMEGEEKPAHTSEAFDFCDLLDHGQSDARLYLVSLVSIPQSLYNDAFYVFYNDDYYVTLNEKILAGNYHKNYYNLKDVETLHSSY